MLRSAFMLGAGFGLVGGMFLVKCCPKAEKMVDDIKSKAKETMSGNCNCNGEGQQDVQQ